MSDLQNTTITCRFCHKTIEVPEIDGAYVCCGMVQGGDPEWMLHPSNSRSVAEWEAERLDAQRDRDVAVRRRRFR